MARPGEGAHEVETDNGQQAKRNQLGIGDAAVKVAERVRCRDEDGAGREGGPEAADAHDLAYRPAEEEEAGAVVGVVALAAAGLRELVESVAQRRVVAVEETVIPAGPNRHD